MNARLRNEFIGDAPEAAKKRQEIFEEYNAAIDQAPEYAVRLLGDLATGKARLDDRYDDKDETLPAITSRVLKATNYGEQIGFVSPDAPWGPIFDDLEYTKARRDVQSLPNSAKNTLEGIALRQHRAFHVLRVAVSIVQQESTRDTNLSHVA